MISPKFEKIEFDGQVYTIKWQVNPLYITSTMDSLYIDSHFDVSAFEFKLSLLDDLVSCDRCGGDGIVKVKSIASCEAVIKTVKLCYPWVLKYPYYNMNNMDIKTPDVTIKAFVTNLPKNDLGFDKITYYYYE